jgi:hypothetical protein
MPSPLGPIHAPVASMSTRRVLLATLWGGYQHSGNNRELDPFFKYYTRESRNALHDEALHISVRTHVDVLEIAKRIEDGETRQDILAALQTAGTGQADQDETLNSSINLTARLISMVDIGTLLFGVTDRTQLEWSQGSLKQFIHDYFNEPCKLDKETVRLEKIFSARNLTRLAGIELVLTDNLADHLRMVGGEDKKVAIFHHAFYLKQDHG